MSRKKTVCLLCTAVYNSLFEFSKLPFASWMTYSVFSIALTVSYGIIPDESADHKYRWEVFFLLGLFNPFSGEYPMILTSLPYLPDKGQSR